MKKKGSAKKKAKVGKPSLSSRVSALEARVSKIEAGISGVVQGANEPESGVQVRLEDNAPKTGE